MTELKLRLSCDDVRLSERCGREKARVVNERSRRPLRRFCLRCGHEYPYDDQRCPHCGASSDGSFEDALVSALAHPIPDTAAVAARVLGTKHVTVAIPALIAASRQSEPERAEAALEALGAFDDDRAHARIAEARHAESARLRAVAIRLSGDTER